MRAFYLETVINPHPHEFPSCGGGGPAHAGGEGYSFSKTIIQPDSQKIKPAVHFCEISVGKVQGKNFGMHAIANIFSDKYAFTKYQPAFHIFIAAVAHIGSHARPNVPPAN